MDNKISPNLLQPDYSHDLPDSKASLVPWKDHTALDLQIEWQHEILRRPYAHVSLTHVGAVVRVSSRRTRVVEYFNVFFRSLCLRPQMLHGNPKSKAFPQDPQAWL